MEVTTDVVNLGKTQLLIMNKSGDDIYVGEVGQDPNDWLPVAAGSAITVKAYNNDTGVVSDGVSDVGILYGGTGIFPPPVAAPDLSGYQPLDADLTAIAAVASQTAYGRSLLTLANQAALGALIGSEVFGKAQPIVSFSGTTRTLQATDVGCLLRATSNSAVTITLPQDSDVTWPLGVYTDVKQVGTGQITFVAGTGATLDTSGLTAKSRGQKSRMGLQKSAANTWDLFGDLAAS